MEGHRMAARTFRETEKKKQSRVFFDVIFMFTLTWITAKELEQVIESKGDEFQWKKNMKIS